MKKYILLFAMVLAVAGVQAYDKNIDLSSPTTSGATWNAVTNTATFTSSSGYVLFAIGNVNDYTSIDVYMSANDGSFEFDIMGSDNHYFAFGASNKDAEGTAYGSAGIKTESTNHYTDIGNITGIRIKPRYGKADGTVTIPSIVFKGLDVNSNTEGFGGLVYTGTQKDLLAGLKSLPYVVNQNGFNFLLGNASTKDGSGTFFDVTDYNVIYFHITDYKSANVQLRASVGTNETRYAYKVGTASPVWTTENAISENGWYYISLDGVTNLRAISTQSLGSASERFTVSQIYLTKSTFTMADSKDAMDIMFDPIGATVAYDRTFTAGQKSTVCLPFALTQDEANAAGTFYEMTAADNEKVTFTEVTSGGTTAYKPYIFKAKETGTPYANLTNKAIEASAGATTSYTVSSNYTFKGTLAASADVAGDNTGYTVYGYSTAGNFVKVGTGVSIKAFRGYITIPSSSPAPSFLNIDFIDGGMGGTTGISEVKSTNANDGVMYNLQGQRVNEGHKGLVIKNGKKVMMK